MGIRIKNNFSEVIVERQNAGKLKSNTCIIKRATRITPVFSVATPEF